MAARAEDGVPFHPEFEPGQVPFCLPRSSWTPIDPAVGMQPSGSTALGATEAPQAPGSGTFERSSCPKVRSRSANTEAAGAREQQHGAQPTKSVAVRALIPTSEERRGVERTAGGLGQEDRADGRAHHGLVPPDTN